jgi:hypothetical protein
VSQETDEQLADTAKSECPLESSMEIDGASPHEEVMQYESVPAIENSIEALPGEVERLDGASPSLLHASAVNASHARQFR